MDSTWVSGVKVWGNNTAIGSSAIIGGYHNTVIGSSWATASTYIYDFESETEKIQRIAQEKRELRDKKLRRIYGQERSTQEVETDTG